MVETVKLLITDDEPAMRMAVKRALRQFYVEVPDLRTEARLEVDEAGSGEEALKKIEADEPDVMMLDLKMPGISGMEVLGHIAEHNPDILAIMVTAHATIQTAVSATKQGAYEFLAKPFTPEELRSILTKTVQHQVLRKHAKRLEEERKRVRFEFISVLAHELKSPINAVESNLTLLKEMPQLLEDPEKVVKNLDRSLNRLQGMRKLILDLLDMTRVESGQKKRELGAVDIVEAAEMTIEGVKLDADKHGIDISLDAPESIVVEADRGEIDIIMNNLVSNAVKYNRDGGSVKVRITGEPDEVWIAVTDTGIGMTREESAKLFNDFVRIKNRKTADIHGSGLGLSIVKKLAELYKGEVSVESEADVGSTFTVVIRPGAPDAKGSGGPD
jgi:two-component system, sensor histidine kinase and response regulator